MAEENEKPLTKEDVLKAIEENGGTADGLDLSGKVFERGINLSGINLKEAVLEECHLEEARLIGANLEGAFLRQAHLENAYLPRANLKNADLVGTHLQKTTLFAAHLEGAELFDAHLEESNLLNAFLDGARLSGAHLNSVHMHRAKFTTNTEMESVDWGNYVLGEEKEWEKKKKETHLLRNAEDIYRRLKQWYTNAGMYDVAGKFYYREMEAKRKSVGVTIHRRSKESKGWRFLRLFLKEKDFWNWFRLWIYRLSCGYGERPFRVVVWATSVVLGLALIYFVLGSVWEWWAFWNSLYFSAVSFTALGYGSWVESSNDWIRGIGAFESFIGVFTIALFLITFIRKMTR